MSVRDDGWSWRGKLRLERRNYFASREGWRCIADSEDARLREVRELEDVADGRRQTANWKQERASLQRSLHEIRAHINTLRNQKTETVAEPPQAREDPEEVARTAFLAWIWRGKLAGASPRPLQYGQRLKD
jgi:hypothetical protein